MNKVIPTSIDELTLCLLVSSGFFCGCRVLPSGEIVIAIGCDTYRPNTFTSVNRDGSETQKSTITKQGIDYALAATRALVSGKLEEAGFYQSKRQEDDWALVVRELYHDWIDESKMSEIDRLKFAIRQYQNHYPGWRSLHGRPFPDYYCATLNDDAKRALSEIEIDAA